MLITIEDLRRWFDEGTATALWAASGFQLPKTAHVESLLAN